MSDLQDIDTDMIRKIVVSARGGNPDAQQTLNDFIKFNNDIERTNLPQRLDVQRMVFVDYAGKAFYPDTDDDPFTMLGQSIATSFMAKGGLKSNQFVDLMRQTPNLADLQTTQESTKRGITDRILGRDKTE